MCRFLKPCKCVHVNLVCVDEAHVFEHTEDALQTHKHNQSISFPCVLSVLLSLPPSFLTMGVVSSGRERGVYVNSAKHGWISFTGSIPVTSSLVTSSSETCNIHILNHMEWIIFTMSGHTECAREGTRHVKVVLPSCDTSSFHWPGGTWTGLRGLACRVETGKIHIMLQQHYSNITAPVLSQPRKLALNINYMLFLLLLLLCRLLCADWFRLLTSPGA